MDREHITISERESILKFSTLGYSNAEIGRQLGRDRATIGREIKRNTIDGEYSPFKAQLAYEKIKNKCGAKNILKESILLIDIQKKSENSRTPEQISGRAKTDKLYNISFKTIYRAIEDAFKLLSRKGKVKKNGVIEKRGTIPDKKMIEERPQKANDRSEIGHYESDTIVGANHKGAIMTYVCRQTRFLIAVQKINKRLRKCLGWKTLHEVF